MRISDGPYRPLSHCCVSSYNGKVRALFALIFFLFFAMPIGGIHINLFHFSFSSFCFHRSGDSMEEITGYGTMKPRNIISSILGQTPAKSKTLAISNPQDFRQVSAIIDVDQVPETCRRVKLLKHGSDKPLGFYIRYGIEALCRWAIFLWFNCVCVLLVLVMEHRFG